MSRVDRDKYPEHFHDRQQKGLLIQLIVKEGCLDVFPSMLQKAGAWPEQSGRKAMNV